MTKSLKGMLLLDKPEPKTFTAIEFDDGRDRSGPKSFIDDGCVYFEPVKKGWLRAWVTLSLYIDGCDEEGYGFYLDWHCRSPHPDHWLSYIEEMSGELAILSWDSSGYGVMCEDEVEHFMMGHGIAPGQRFVTEILFDCTRDYWGEYDEYLEGRVMDVEPWSTEQTLSAWDDYFKVIRPGGLHGIGSSGP